LLKHNKVAVNQQGNKDDTALIAASANGHTAIVTIVETPTRLDVRIQNENGDTALIAASANGHTA
jgi:ankyrin repeat protein